MESNEMNATEKELVKAINKVDIDEVRRLISSGLVNVNCLDEQGMSPLLHAAYKGNGEMTELLLGHGGDVNSNQQEHGYTALMFSCIAGAVDVTKQLLEAGANVNAENKLGKTAAQLGAFVGQHDCVSLLNNFISQEDLLYYTKPQGFEKEGKLDSKLVPLLYKYIVMTSLNPVKLIYFLKDHMELIENYKSVYKVLELKCEKLVKQKTMNEVMSMKLHFYGYTVKTCGRWHHGLDGKDGIEGLLKYLVRGRPSDGFALGTEDFIRQSIKDFEYPQCTIFQQLVSTLSPVKRGSEPTALTVFTQAINGIQSADFSKSCSVCGEKKNVKKCVPCKMVGYCSVDCQRIHWSTHKKHCKRLAAQYKEQIIAEENLKKQTEMKEAEEEKQKDEKDSKSQKGEESENEARQNGVEKPSDEKEMADLSQGMTNLGTS